MKARGKEPPHPPKTNKLKAEPWALVFCRDGASSWLIWGELAHLVVVRGVSCHRGGPPPLGGLAEGTKAKLIQLPLILRSSAAATACLLSPYNRTS